MLFSEGRNMYNNDLTLDTTVYSLIQERPTSSVRRDASKPLDNPVGFTISHETSKNGKISSVFYFDDEKIVDVAGVPVSSNARVQFKISYNPTEGRTDLTTALQKGIDVLESFLADPTNVTKFLNLEH
jgi:hypothetical protein